MIKRSLVNLTAIDSKRIINDELPNLNYFYNQSDELHADVHWLFGDFIDNRFNHAIVDVDERTASNIMHDATQHYRMMLAALKVFFEQDDSVIEHYMRCSATELPSFRTFLDYARESFRIGDQAIYGRYDLAIDSAGTVQGAYELNGDTPVMLFESVNLQNMVSETLGNTDAQYNNWWAQSLNAFRHWRGKTVAVACQLGYVEDLSTTETIMQVMHEVGAEAYLCDIKHLNHDLLHIEKPFEIDGVHNRPDGVFILLPWEEMLESGFEILANWRSWHRSVKFLEPAWRWFMSNKGFMAWITHLLETDRHFNAQWYGVKHIPTYLEQGTMVNYVAKPKIGRLGQNISVVRGEDVNYTEGRYEYEDCVFQPIVPTAKLEDRSIIATAWIADGKAETLAFRVFGGEVTNLADEYWIPHRLVD